MRLCYTATKWDEHGLNRVMKFTKTFFKRLFLIETSIFLGVAIVSYLTAIDYPSLLFLFGFSIIVMGFIGSSPVGRLNQIGGLGSDTMESQMIRDFNETDQINRLQAMMSDVVIIGIIPPVAGVLIYLI